MSVIEVHSEEFRQRLDRWQSSIHTMVNTLAKIAKITDDHARDEQAVPYFTGDLEKSFTFLVADGSHELQVAMTYSSIAEDGYDYALAQHENFYRHPVQGYDHYLDYVMYDITSDERWTLLETDYLSLFKH